MKKRIALNISIVIYAVVLLLGGYGSMQCEASEPLMSDQSIARYKIEDLGDEGTAFDYGPFRLRTKVTINVKVGLWRKDYFFPDGMWLVISWPDKNNSEKFHEKKIPLDESYCLDGDGNFPESSDQWKDVTCSFYMWKFNIPDEADFKVYLKDSENDDESVFTLEERNYMRFEKIEEGVVLYSYEEDDL